MDNSNLINPFKLLGISSKSNLPELKKNYYNQALFWHPDRGGNNQDMHIIHLAYQYAKQQLEKIKDTTYEDLEDEFETFCKQQESIKPPTFSSIYEETNDWVVQFNKEFENQKKWNHESSDDNILDASLNPFNSGYGDLMEDSDLAKKLNVKCDSNIINDENNSELDCSNTVLDYNNAELDYNKLNLSNDKITNHFPELDIIEYKEPILLPDTICHYPIDGKEINDYSHYTDKLIMTDYKKSFTPYNYKKLLNTVDEKDYPTELLEYNSNI